MKLIKFKSKSTYVFDQFNFYGIFKRNRKGNFRIFSGCDKIYESSDLKEIFRFIRFKLKNK